jgi:hypothetical protein
VGYDDPTTLAAAVAALVPGVEVRARAAGPLRRLLRSAVAGVDAVIELDVDAAGRPPLRVVVPRRPDTAIEVLGRAVATTLAARVYLGASADHVVRMSIDRSSKGLVNRTSAGEAGHLHDTFHLNADFLVAGGTGDDRFLASTNRFEGTVVHEIWHVVEAGVEARSYRSTVEFRRRLGQSLGVETLERATRSWAPGASSDSAIWQAAVARLGAEVSDYATTNPKEATAEMFRLWWTVDEPSSTVSLFGSLLPSYIGVEPGLPPPRRAP